MQKNKKIKALFLVPYPKNSAPSQRLKFEQYFDYFAENDIEVTLCSFLTEKMYPCIYENGNLFKKSIYVFLRLLVRFKHIWCARKYDVVCIHLDVSPLRCLLYEKLLFLLNQQVIYDVDDLIYLQKEKKGFWKYASLVFSKTSYKVQYLIKKSKHVIVGTEYLKSYVLNFNKNVTNISSSINTNIYTPKFHQEKKQVCIGWSGSYSTAPYLKILLNVLKRLQQKYNIKIKVIGDRNFKIEDLNIKAKDWEEKTEVEELKEIDIGLYPLPNNEWVLGKSGGKALQYMALGIPPVCSAIGTNFEIIEDGENGFLAKNDEEWFEKISKLIESSELRNKIGKNARKTIEEKYSFKVNAPVYLKLIKDLVKK